MQERERATQAATEEQIQGRKYHRPVRQHAGVCLRRGPPGGPLEGERAAAWRKRHRKGTCCQGDPFHEPRAKGPFIKSTARPFRGGFSNAELFGHEKGRSPAPMAMRKGRFELAHGGSISSDEIGDLPITLQPKILRVLQEKEFERVGGERNYSCRCPPRWPLPAETSRFGEGRQIQGRSLLPG